MIGVRTGATLVPVFCDGQKKPFHKTRIIFGEPYVPQITGRRGTSESCRRSRTMCCARRMRSAVRRWEARRCEGHSC